MKTFLTYRASAQFAALKSLTPVLFLFVVGMLLQSPLHAQAVYDNNGVTGGGGRNITVPAGYNRVLVVHGASFGTNVGATFDGKPQTFQITKQKSGWTGRNTLYVFALGSGCEFTAHLSIQGGGGAGGSRILWAGTFQHINQSNPVKDFGSANIIGGNSITTVGGLSNEAGMDILIDAVVKGDNNEEAGPGSALGSNNTILHDRQWSGNQQRAMARLKPGTGGNASLQWNIGRGFAKPHVAIVLDGIAQESFQIIDTAPPVALCKSDISIALNSSGVASLSFNQVDNGSYDDCRIESKSISQSSFTPLDIGSKVITLSVTDRLGQNTTCTSNLTVTATDYIYMACKDATTAIDPDGTATITTSDIDDGSLASEGIASLSLNRTTFYCGHVGTPQSVTLTVTDNNGGTKTCSAQVTVEDNMAPVVACKSIDLLLNQANPSQVTISNNALVDWPDSDDNCGISDISLSKNTFNCSDVGQINSVIVTATDNAGNSSTCTATVSLFDVVNPTASCKNTTLQLSGAGSNTISVQDINDGSSDNCGIDRMELDNDSFDCSNIGDNTVALIVIDAEGNESFCTATVTVQGSFTPTAACKNASIQLDASGNASISTQNINNGSSDDCGISNMSLDNTTFDCNNLGNSNTVTLTVTNINGNSASCAATVTVEDNRAPLALCKNTMAQLDVDGDAVITTQDINNGSSDNCGVSNISLSNTTFTCDNAGNNTVTLTVTDQSGNSSNCTATVDIQDNIAPTAVCKNATVELDANGNATITAQDVDNGSNDNCGVAILSLNNSSFDCSNVNTTNTITLKAIDASGNSNICSANITVIDGAMPSAVCKPVVVYLGIDGNATITEDAVNDGSSDPCGGLSFDTDITSFDCSNLGANTVVLTVTDGNNQSASCNATVSVVDDTAPTAVCHASLVQIGADGNYTIKETDVFDAGTSDDNCGIISVDFMTSTFTCDEVGNSFSVPVTVTDASGNSSTCISDITLMEGTDLADGWATQDVGQAPIANDYSFDPCATAASSPIDGQYTLTGSSNNGTNTTTDNIAFASQTICGDGTITAKIESVSSNGYGGLMIRESGDAGAKQAAIFSNMTSSLRHESRATTNGVKQVQNFFKPSPIWLRLQRQGDWIFAYYSADGNNFQYIHAVYVAMQDCVEFGLASFTYVPNNIVDAIFSNVLISGASSTNGGSVDNIGLPDETSAPLASSIGKSVVWPNPASETFNISLEEPLKTDALVHLYNMQGQVIEQREIQAGTLQIEWSATRLKSGNYYLAIQQNGNSIETLPIVINR